MNGGWNSVLKETAFFHNLLDKESSNSGSVIHDSSSLRSQDRIAQERKYSDDSAEIYGHTIKSVDEIEDEDFAHQHGAYADEPLAVEEWLQE